MVVLAYLAVLAVILFPPTGLRDEEIGDGGPWWRNARFWASVVILVQIAVYARWG